MNTLTKIVAAGMLSMFAGCGEKQDADFGNNYIKNDTPAPKHYCLSQRSDNIWAFDLDGDKKIDEAFQFSGLRLDAGLVGIKQATELTTPDQHYKWQHMVAPGMEQKAFLKSSRTRPMTDEERTVLTQAAALLDKYSK